MADPVIFPEANTDLRGGNTGAMDIRVWRSKEKDRWIVCWSLSPIELQEVNKTGRVWTSTNSVAFPPMQVLGETPFVHGDEATQQIVTQEKLDALSRIKDVVGELGPSWFEGSSEFARTLRKIREEASHA